MPAMKPGFQQLMSIGGMRMLQTDTLFSDTPAADDGINGHLAALWLNFTLGLQVISPRFIPWPQSHKFLAF